MKTVPSELLQAWLAFRQLPRYLGVFLTNPWAHLEAAMSLVNIEDISERIEVMHREWDVDTARELVAAKELRRTEGWVSPNPKYDEHVEILEFIEKQGEFKPDQIVPTQKKKWKKKKQKHRKELLIAHQSLAKTSQKEKKETSIEARKSWKKGNPSDTRKGTKSDDFHVANNYR